MKTYMSNYRMKKATETNRSNDDTEEDLYFTNRMQKSRSIKKMKDALPSDPLGRTAVLKAYLDPSRISKSPAVKTYREQKLQSNENVDSASIGQIKEFLDEVKNKRNDSARTALKVLKTSVSGENLQRTVVTSLAKRLGINRGAIKAGQRIRTQIIHTVSSAFKYTERKTRSDAITEGLKAKIFDYWMKPENSRPSNNKNDVKRVRLGPGIFSSHTNYILERTQTEVNEAFKEENRDIRVAQRTFERCKPYFIRQASTKDKLTCCCRHHVEARSLFRSCTAYQKKVLTQKRADDISVYASLNDLCNDTLCPLSANTHQHKLSCLSRDCGDCGVQKLNLLPHNFDHENDTVTWQRYEYKNIEIKGKKSTRKLILVHKNTSPDQMFAYFESLLKDFPAHQMRASWQNKQLKHLKMNLPLGHCVTIHDFAENYRCIETNEIQSSYFQKIEVSLHVSIIHRHAVLEVDGTESTTEEPQIITEQFFVISPDTTHDHHFVHAVQQQIADYLQNIRCPVETMIEFTDGCSQQYKSRHCLGDLSHSCEELGYNNLTRNFFETAHARGPQDAAGGFVKRQCDMAVYRGEIIQNARKMFEYANENLCSVSSTAKCSRRIFRYLDCDEINRNRDRYFEKVDNNRKIHQATFVNTGQINIRNLSCYTCDMCIDGRFHECQNDEYLGKRKLVQMKKERQKENSTEIDDVEESLPDPLSLVCRGTIIAAKADDDRLPYYILKASSNVYETEDEVTDSWQATFPVGRKVIRGHYYDTIQNNKLQLRILKRLPAVVPAESVIYILTEVVEENGKLNLSESLHRRILCLQN